MIIVGNLFCVCCIKYDESLRELAAFDKADVVVKALNDIFNMKIYDLIVKHSKICSPCASKLKEFYEFYKMVNNNKLSDLTISCDLSAISCNTLPTSSSSELFEKNIMAIDLDNDNELQNIFSDVRIPSPPPLTRKRDKSVGSSSMNSLTIDDALKCYDEPPDAGLVRIPTPPPLTCKSVCLSGIKELKTGDKLRLKIDPATKKMTFVPISAAGTSVTKTVTPASLIATTGQSTSTTVNEPKRTSMNPTNGSKSTPVIRFDAKTGQAIVGSMVATKVNLMSKPEKWSLKKYPSAKKVEPKPPIRIMKPVDQTTNPFKLIPLTSPTGSKPLNVIQLKSPTTNKTVMTVTKPKLNPPRIVTIKSKRLTISTPTQKIPETSTNADGDPILDLTNSPTDNEKDSPRHFTFQTVNGVQRVTVNTSTIPTPTARRPESPLAIMPNLEPAEIPAFRASTSTPSTSRASTLTPTSTTDEPLASTSAPEEAKNETAKSKTIKRFSLRRKSAVGMPVFKMRKVDPTKAVVRIKRLTPEEIAHHTKRKR